MSEIYANMDLESKRSLLHHYNDMYWDAQDQLHEVSLARAALMNSIMQDELLPAPVPGDAEHEGQ
jgi:hypothetical protein